MDYLKLYRRVAGLGEATGRKSTSYAEPLAPEGLTKLNLSVLKREVEAAGGVIRKVEATSVAHLKRAIRAGALQKTGDGGWELSEKGKALLAGVAEQTESAPWDRLAEAAGERYVDVGKAKLYPDAIKLVRRGLADFVRANPTEKVFYVRDPNQLLPPSVTAAALKAMLSGDGNASAGTFGFDNSDQEIYADGSGPFGGVWDLEVTHAMDYGQNRLLKKMPPEVTLEPVQGKTGAGWKVVLSQSLQTYLDAGIKAAEREAASLALKGFYPQGEQGQHSRAPKSLRAKYFKQGPKTQPKTFPRSGAEYYGCEDCDAEGCENCRVRESRKPSKAIQRLSDSRATDMARLKRLAGI